MGRGPAAPLPAAMLRPGSAPGRAPSRREGKGGSRPLLWLPADPIQLWQLASGHIIPATCCTQHSPAHPEVKGAPQWGHGLGATSYAPPPWTHSPALTHLPLVIGRGQRLYLFGREWKNWRVRSSEWAPQVNLSLPWSTPSFGVLGLRRCCRVLCDFCILLPKDLGASPRLIFVFYQPLIALAMIP